MPIHTKRKLQLKLVWNYIHIEEIFRLPYKTWNQESEMGNWNEMKTQQQYSLYPH